jgi:predicted RecB family nuclease
MDARTLRQLKRPWGSGEQRVGKAAKRILVQASAIFEEYGDIPFVHWADYEKTRLKSYIVKFGDPGRVAARVLDKCFDLLTAVRRSIALPVPSYIRAGEKDDEGERARIMDEILRYNEEDLQATWAVFRWAEANQRIP